MINENDRTVCPKCQIPMYFVNLRRIVGAKVRHYYCNCGTADMFPVTDRILATIKHGNRK